MMSYANHRDAEVTENAPRSFLVRPQEISVWPQCSPWLCGSYVIRQRHQAKASGIIDSARSMMDVALAVM
jgi:hypothetical protein